MLDASNAINSLNHRAALLNMFHLCPPLATNTYHSASHLFIDGSSLLSQEGTTQGDFLALPMYAIGIIPVMRQLMGLARQVWHADDAAAWVVCFILGIGGLGCCHLVVILVIMLMLLRFGWLLNMDTWLRLSASLIILHGIQITSAGRPYLGTPLDSRDCITDYMQDCVSQWVQGLSHLSPFAATQPHAAFAVLVNGFLSKLNYYLQTTPNINNLLSPLELASRQTFLPTVIPHPPSDIEQELFSLPISLGGLGILILTSLQGRIISFRMSCLVLWLI